MEVCQRSGKVKHLDKGKANAHLRRVRQCFGYPNGHVYRCPYCRTYHVGSPRRQLGK